MGEEGPQQSNESCDLSLNAWALMPLLFNRRAALMECPRAGCLRAEIIPRELGQYLPC